MLNDFHTWNELLSPETKQPYYQELINFLANEYSAKTIYPAQHDVFNCLRLTAWLDIKVVLIGQDPYHGPEQAHGLCFSVLPGVTPPPSLKNIFKELQRDLGIAPAAHGCLEKWAKQGVLLLNTVLTVEAGKPQSHVNHGWEIFTDKIIKILNAEKSGLIFLLWGNDAKKKLKLIDKEKHFVLTAAHPSPLSANRGFIGCKHFSKVNEILINSEREPIDW